MKVVQINAVYGHGSTGTIVRDIENLCEQQGIKCYVASPDLKVREAKRGYVVGSTLDHKVHALLARINGQQAYFSHLATQRLLRWMDEVKPDIVHLHNLHSNFIHLNHLLRYLASNNIKTIATLHDCWYYTGGCFHYTQARCQRWQTTCGRCPKKKTDTPAWFLDKSSQILSDRKRCFDAIPNLVITGVSQWIGEECQRGIFRGKRVETIFNGVDTAVFKPTAWAEIIPSETLNTAKQALEGHFVVMGLATKWIDPINRDALTYILSQMQPADRLLLFGCNDAQLATIAALPLSAQQREKLVPVGYTTNRQQLAALYTLADVFINCTREESFSLINVGPQACGTPVVTYANTGAQETVNNLCSYGVSTGDFKAMWEKANLIRKIGKAHYSVACIQWVKSRFDMNENYQKYLDLYLEQQ